MAPPRPKSLRLGLPRSCASTAPLATCLRTPPPSYLFTQATLRPIARWQARPFATSSAFAARSKTPHLQDDSLPTTQEFERRRSTRSPTSKSSLRRAAGAPNLDHQPKICTAYCTAEKYSLPLAAEILRNNNYTIDPLLTGLVDQVLHVHVTVRRNGMDEYENGDVFIFPTGNIVAWSIPSAQISTLASLLTPAAEAPCSKEVETEDLEYIEDPRIRKGRISGDVIILGTAPRLQNELAVTIELESAPEQGESDAQPPLNADTVNITLAKVAFSSGLARSTKLAVLESLLNNYLETTSTIPTLLSRGSRLPFTRSFILRKTGELLQFRAQLNLYSELTDSLPDIFWDSRHELGLEGYYESVGRALDVDVRIRQLNEKLDYASGIVEVLRERLSERHGLALEWMIIILITVEVVFEVVRLWKEGSGEVKEERRYRQWKEKKERENDEEYQMWLKGEAN